MKKLALLVLLVSGLVLAFPVAIDGVLKLSTFTEGGKPAANLKNSGGLIFVSDAVNGTPRVQVNNAVQWINIPLEGTSGSGIIDGIHDIIPGPLTIAAGIIGGGFNDNLNIVTSVTGYISTAGTGGSSDVVIEIADDVETCTCTFPCNAAVGTLQGAFCTGVCQPGASIGTRQWVYTITSVGDCATPATFTNFSIRSTYRGTIGTDFY